MTGKEAGHKFLARLGKTRLRPGGKQATEWLLAKGGISEKSRVLEVACNMGTTAIEIARRFGCSVTAVDMDRIALEQARRNVEKHGLTKTVIIEEADALHLPYPDGYFDVVINEAMLTMYADKAKARLIAEYYRVLKPSGKLLTHDIMLSGEGSTEAVVEQMRRAINVSAQPMTQNDWLALFNHNGFSHIFYSNGPMTLLSPTGLLHDEGIKGTIRILCRALKKENRPLFLQMFHTFRRHRHQLNYIAVCSVK